MDSYENKNSRSIIIPRARPSLESYRKRRETMGRYGVDKRTSNKVVLSTDEIDSNVLSKLKRSSPVTINKDAARKLDLRRHSYDSEINYDEDSSSDENDESENASTQKTFTSNESLNVTRSSVNSSLNRSDAHEEVSDGTRKNSSHMYAFIIPVILAVVIMYRPLNNSSGIYDQSSFSRDMSKLGQKYKVNDDAILLIKAGISTTYQRRDTSSIIFAYDSTKQNFNPDLFNDFIEDTALLTSKLLRNESISTYPVLVNSYNLDMGMYEELIKKYRADVDKNGVMLLKELDMLPSHLAMAFHYYCDEYNPLIEKSVIFFTLDMHKCQRDRKSLDEDIWKCLAKKWSTVPIDNVEPLLTRVVGIIVDFTSEFQ